MKRIAIIPARGGSKRIPRKNIIDFCGKPIISYSIQAAIDSNIFDYVMVSTDDEEIAEISKKYGASVPFYRSSELSSDSTMIYPVLNDVILNLEKRGEFFDQLCCIFPCAPFVTSEKLKLGMELISAPEVECVFPVIKFSFPPQRGLVMDGDFIKMAIPENYNVRSQDLESIYHDAGQFYWLKTSALKNSENTSLKISKPIIISELEAQDIDTIEDLRMAELKFRMLFDK